jgi:hypothetical protein
MRMPCNRETTLTGRARARPGLFGKQVFQVEVRVLSYSACPPPPGRDPQQWTAKMRSEGSVEYYWRDARWDDVAAKELFLHESAG